MVAQLALKLDAVTERDAQFQPLTCRAQGLGQSMVRFVGNEPAFASGICHALTEEEQASCREGLATGLIERWLIANPNADLLALVDATSRPDDPSWAGMPGPVVEDLPCTVRRLIDHRQLPRYVDTSSTSLDPLFGRSDECSD